MVYLDHWHSLWLLILLISTIFVTVFFLLPLIIVPIFMFHNFSDFCGFIGACYDSIFSSFSAYDLCSFFFIFFTFLLVVLECAIYITNIMDSWRKWELEALISSCPLMVENQQLVLHIHGSTTVDSTTCGLWSTVICIHWKKNVGIYGSTQFKPMLFKGQL